MKNVIIGIHGLGNKPQRALLEHWWKLSMAEGLKLAGFRSDLPKFEMVCWADIIYDEPLNASVKDVKSQLYLDERYSRASKDFQVKDSASRKKVIDFIGSQLNKIFLNDDMTLNYSFLTDAILKRYFRDLEIYYNEESTDDYGNLYSIRDLIRKRLSDVLEKYRNDNIMLVSHSMGTIIAFDVMTFSVPHIKINTFVTMGSPLGLPVIIGKIASEHKQKYPDRDRLKTPQSVYGSWYNFSDIHDKIAFHYKLGDDFPENQSGIKPVDYLVVNNYELHGIRNPHKSYGYLRTPEFAAILNDFIKSEKLTMIERIIRSIVRHFSSFKNSIFIRK